MRDGSRTAPAAITTPFWDGVLVGGLSLAGMSAALVYAFLTDGGWARFDKSDWIVLSVLVNSTHFVVSYRLLYDTPDVLRRSPWAAVYVPATLVALLGLRLWGPERDLFAEAIVVAASLYLAVHYTGQAWGMVSAFGRMGGLELEPVERRAIRAGLFALLGIHLLLAIGGKRPPAEWIEPARYVELYRLVFRASIAVALGTLLIGAAAFWRARRRGQNVPVRAVLPWLSLYLWYPTWYLVPGGPLWVQLSHALQYLSFPLRVEANRHVARTGGVGRSAKLHVLLVYVVLVVVGVIVLKGPPLATRTFGPGWYSTPFVRDAFTTWVLLVNIHHFFIDGALWKLRNPEVRRELFAHLSDAPAAGARDSDE